MGALAFDVVDGTKGVLDFTLQYGSNWTGPETPTTPIPQTALERVWFAAREKTTDTEPAILLSDADSTEIEWLDTVNGQIRIFVGLATGGHIGKLYWEVKVQWAADHKPSVLAQDVMTVLPTYTGNPDPAI